MGLSETKWFTTENWAIKPDNDGFAHTTTWFRVGQCGGQVIASQTPVTGWVVAFPLQQGRAHIQCLVYIEKTAPPAVNCSG